MSDDKSGFGGKFGGPKKPKATFGDVMLGIPSGGQGRDGPPRGKDRPDRGERRGRDDRSPRRAEAAPAAPATPPSAPAPTSPSEAAEHKDTGPRRERKGRGEARGSGSGERKKPQGPLVVVKRASGVVETRPLGEATPVMGQSAEVAHPAPNAEPVLVHVRGPSVADVVPESETFEELFEAQAKDGGGTRRQVRVGEKVKGKIFQLGKDTAFVSLGGRSEAMIDMRELQDEEGILRLGVGDEVEAHVIEAGAKGIMLSKTLSKGTASMAMLAEARLSGIPVEGIVLSVNKGGLEVAIGDVRAFCPVSQIDLKFVEKPDQYVGERLKFRVTEIKDRGGVVVSRRALLEEEQRAQAAETRKKLQTGAVLKGRVTSVREFGVFVDIGGVEGMIALSELSHVRVEHPSELVKAGDEVEVEILKIEAPNPNAPDKAKHKERIALSMRSRMEDPWKAALEEIKEGQKLSGKVARLAAFGAFIELRPGVDGLIHISALSSRRIAHPRDVVRVGDEVQVSVEKVDPAEKRIGLRLLTAEGEVVGRNEAAAAAAAAETPRKPEAATEQAPRPKVGQVITGKVDRIEQYGIFVAFPGGKGLVPASETGTERGTDLKRHFPMGTEVKAEILEIEGGKIRLSITAAVRSEERADMDAYRKTQQPKGAGKKGFGTFADLLKEKGLLDPKQ